MENPFEIIEARLIRNENLLSDLKIIGDFVGNESHQRNEILNTDEASLFLSIAKPTLYGMTSQMRIPHYKTGKKLYFLRSELMAWLRKSKIQTDI